MSGSPQFVGLMIGGVLPALCFGVSGLLAKTSTNAGIGIGTYLLAVAMGVLSVALVALFVLPKGEPTTGAYLAAYFAGLCWAVGAGAVSFVLIKFGIPIAKLVPLYNTNTLVAVLLGLIVYAEWRQVNVLYLLVGSLLVIVGGIVVTKA